MHSARPILIVVLSLYLTALTARAQQGPAWVDPPEEAPESAAAPESKPADDTAPAPGWVDPHARPSRHEVAARQLANEYLATISGPELVTSARRFYAERIRFHGRLISLRGLVADKNRFARRWPQRRYEAIGPLHVSCDTARETCVVRSTLRFEAASERRGQRTSGTAELLLTIGFENGEPIIFAETSRVLRRGLASNADGRIMRTG